MFGQKVHVRARIGVRVLPNIRGVCWLVLLILHTCVLILQNFSKPQVCGIAYSGHVCYTILARLPMVSRPCCAQVSVGGIDTRLSLSLFLTGLRPHSRDLSAPGYWPRSSHITEMRMKLQSNTTTSLIQTR